MNRKIEFDQNLIKDRIVAEIAKKQSELNAVEEPGLVFSQHIETRGHTQPDKQRLARIASGLININTRGAFAPQAGQATRKAIISSIAADTISGLPFDQQQRLAIATWEERNRLGKPPKMDDVNLIDSTSEFIEIKPPNGHNERLVLVNQQMILAKVNGLWPDDKHQFGLKDEPIRLPQQSLEQINEIGSALFGVGGVLNGIVNTTRLLLTTEPNHPISRSIFNKMSGLEKRILFLGTKPTSLVRLDLMIDEQDNIQIAEIEAGGKVHGLGFGLFTELIRDEKSTDMVGVVRGVIKLIKAEKIFEPINFVVTSKFFDPEIRFLTKSTADEGIVSRTIVVDPRSGEDNSRIPNGLFFNLPPDSPSQWQKAWMDNMIKVILPPRPILGLKTSLVLLSNQTNDPIIEALLLKCIDFDKLWLIRKHLPESWLSGDIKGKEGEAIFKTAKDSGAKGISVSQNVFSEIVMRRIHQKSFDGKFARLAAFMTPDGLITMPITLSSNEIVHGGRDNIQTTFTF